MEDDASILLDGKTLANLRVVDLKLELEKRGLSKSGSKKDLVKRLKQQLEFEKLSSERKSTGDCDLKLELDADTEQNEFVQQYLAQQQKIYAEQKEVKRRVELEEIQKSGDEKESCDSAKDDDKTEDEAETTNQNAITDFSLSHKHVKNKKYDPDDVFKAEDTVSVPSIPQDPKNTEEEKEKELSTAISSLLSVEKTESKLEDEKLLCNEDIPLVEATRSTHDDDREKDLATAVLSSLLVEDQNETEAKEGASQEEVAYNATEDTLQLPMESEVHSFETDSKDADTKNMKVEPVEDACNTTKVELSTESDVLPSQLSAHGLETKAEDQETKNVEVMSQVQDVCHVTRIPLQLSTESNVQPSIDPVTRDSKNKFKYLDTKEAVSPVVYAYKSTAVPSQLVVESNVCSLETKCKDVEACKEDHTTVIVPAPSSKESGIVVPKPGVLKHCSTEDVVTELSVVESCEKVVAVELDMQSAAKDESVDHNPVSASDDKKLTTESSEITQPEIIAKMDVSSVPYSLAEIQLPESPGKIAKPQAKLQVANESIKPTELEGDVQNNTNSSCNEKPKNSDSGDLNGKDTTSKEDQSSSLVKVGDNSDVPKSPLKKESDKTTRRVKDSEGNKSKRNRSVSDSGSENDTKSRSTKRKDHVRRKKYDSSDDDRSPVKKSSTTSKKHKDRKSDSSRDRSKSPKKVSERSSRRNRKRSISSDDDRSSRTHSKKNSPKRESRRKRDRRHRSSSSEDEQFKAVKEGSPKKKKGQSEDERPSKMRSRSPIKSVKDSTSKRVRKDQSSEDEQSSKTRSKSPKKSSKDSSSKRVRKNQSSEDEQASKTQSKSPNKTVVDSGSKRVPHEPSSEEDQPLKESTKSPKKLVEESKHSKSTGSENEHPLKESTKSPIKLVEESKHSKSTGSENEHPSRTQDSVEGKKEQYKSSEGEQHPHTHSKDSPERDSRSSYKERKQKRRDKSFEDKRDEADLDSLPKQTSCKSDELVRKDIQDVCKADNVKPEGKSIECLSVEPVKSSISRDRSPRSPLKEKEGGKCSSRSKSPENAKSDSMTLEANSMTCPKDDKKAPKDKSDLITTEPKDTNPEKGICSPKDSHKDKESPEKFSEAPSKDSLLKAVPEKLKKKADVSEGELSSSRENSPYRKQKIVVIRRQSSNSEAPVEGTMTVIRKEAPKQRIKIKRDNVVVVKKEEERLPEKELRKTDDSVSKVAEPVEEQKLEPGECPEAAPYVSSRKITLSNRKRTEKPADESTGKRSKWGSFAASRNKSQQPVNISTDSLKNWFPDFKLLKEPAVIEPVLEEPTSPTKESNDVEVSEKKDSEEPKVTITTRKSDHRPPPQEESVAVAPMQLEEEGVTPTKILFVRNLVRPFTLLQLKELLKETGNVVEDKFWIDKIKSKCFVVYESEEEAVKTRSVLNGARWPTSNPKILAVDFATEEDLEYHRSGAVDQPKPRPQSPPPNQPSLLHPEDEEPRDRRAVEREGRRDRVGHLPMREWDKDKVTQDSPEKQDRRRGDEGKGADKERKEKRARVGLEETPAKLLDDLFQKTKATPCIYWLPLTQEQVKAKAEQARLDRERRQQEQENRRPHSKQRTRETDTHRSSTRSRSPVTRRR